jgi:hypothetical protein
MTAFKLVATKITAITQPVAYNKIRLEVLTVLVVVVVLTLLRPPFVVDKDDELLTFIFN